MRCAGIGQGMRADAPHPLFCMKGGEASGLLLLFAARPVSDGSAEPLCASFRNFSRFSSIHRTTVFRGGGTAAGKGSRAARGPGTGGYSGCVRQGRRYGCACVMMLSELFRCRKTGKDGRLKRVREVLGCVCPYRAVAFPPSTGLRLFGAGGLPPGKGAGWRGARCEWIFRMRPAGAVRCCPVRNCISGHPAGGRSAFRGP